MRDRPKTLTAIHSPSGLKFLPLEKTIVIIDYLEKQFSPYDLCEENCERQVVVCIQALFEAVHNNPPERIRPYDVKE
jgi:hypothetical protein